MEVKAALLGQYRAGIAMLRNCIEVCPDDLWSEGRHPRAFWRIAYHALFYTHFYLSVDHETFTPWEKHVWHGIILWEDDESGVPPVETTFSQADLLSYVAFLEQNVAGLLEVIDLDSASSGFPWYAIPKLDHQLVNIRHLGVHVGQLQELLFARGIDTDWVGRR